MGQRQDQLAGLACPARLVSIAGAITKDRLGEPKGEPLLTDAAGTLEQQSLW
jgi:hypothetical protein